jgi:hypothetical protein
MPDNPMKNDDEVQRRESPGQSAPTQQPDKSSEDASKDRKAQDEDLQEKQGPGSFDPDAKH